MPEGTQRKLSGAARQLVRQRIIAGDTNNEIRKALKEAGYCSDVSDQALSNYRRDPEVQEAKALAREFVHQIGIADYARRIEELVEYAALLRKRIFYTGDYSEIPPQPTDNLVALSNLWLSTLREIAKQQKDEERTRRSQEAPRLPAHSIEINNLTLLLASLDDLHQHLLRQKEQSEQGVIEGEIVEGEFYLMEDG